MSTQPKRLLLVSRDLSLIVALRRAAERGGRTITVVDPASPRAIQAHIAGASVVAIAFEDLMPLLRDRLDGGSLDPGGPPVVVLAREEQLFDVAQQTGGRVGVVLRLRDDATLMERIDLALDGYTAFPAGVLERLHDSRLRLEIVDSLPEQDRQVLLLLGDALSNRDIAVRLGIGEARVKTLVRRLMQKLHFRNRTSAALFVVRSNLAARYRRNEGGPSENGH